MPIVAIASLYWYSFSMLASFVWAVWLSEITTAVKNAPTVNLNAYFFLLYRNSIFSKSSISVLAGLGLSSASSTGFPSTVTLIPYEAISVNLFPTGNSTNVLPSVNCFVVTPLSFANENSICAHIVCMGIASSRSTIHTLHSHFKDLWVFIILSY